MRDIRAELGIAPHQPVLTCLAKYDRQKGLEVLIKAMPALKVLFPDIAVIVVGTGPEEARLSYLELATRCKVLEHLHLVGAQADVRPYLEACDVYVQPSLYEGMGIALVEAMAMEKPCVSTNVTAIPEVVEDGVSGLLVPPGCPLTLAIRIAQLVIDPDLCERMGQAGRRIACEKFEIAKTVPQLEAVYREVAAERWIWWRDWWRFPAGMGFAVLIALMFTAIEVYEWSVKQAKRLRFWRPANEVRA